MDKQRRGIAQCVNARPTGDLHARPARSVPSAPGAQRLPGIELGAGPPDRVEGADQPPSHFLSQPSRIGHPSFHPVLPTKPESPLNQNPALHAAQAEPVELTRDEEGVFPLEIGVVPSADHEIADQNARGGVPASEIPDRSGEAMTGLEFIEGPQRRCDLDHRRRVHRLIGLGRAQNAAAVDREVAQPIGVGFCERRDRADEECDDRRDDRYPHPLHLSAPEAVRRGPI